MTMNAIMKALDFAYDKAVEGAPGCDTAVELAADYLEGEGALTERAMRLVKWQCVKSGTSGFVTGLGGIATLPVAIPANLVSVLYVQLRMIAAIAHMGGCDVRDDRVRALAYACLTGSAAHDIVKQAGIKAGLKLGENAVKKIPGEALKALNRAVGFRLVTKFGSKGVVNLGRLVPVLGGLIGGAGDVVSTMTIGKVAIGTFLATA